MHATVWKQLYLVSKDSVKILLLENIEIADTCARRMKGLLGRRGLFESSGMVITPCNYVHTFGMKFNIDIVFIDKHYHVVGLKRGVKKNKISGVVRAKHTLEISEGNIDALQINLGDKLVWL